MADLPPRYKSVMNEIVEMCRAHGKPVGVVDESMRLATEFFDEQVRGSNPETADWRLYSQDRRMWRIEQMTFGRVFPFRRYDLRFPGVDPGDVRGGRAPVEQRQDNGGTQRAAPTNMGTRVQGTVANQQVKQTTAATQPTGTKDKAVTQPMLQSSRWADGQPFQLPVNTKQEQQATAGKGVEEAGRGGGPSGRGGGPSGRGGGNSGRGGGYRGKGNGNNGRAEPAPIPVVMRTTAAEIQMIRNRHESKPFFAPNIYVGHIQLSLDLKTEFVQKLWSAGDYKFLEILENRPAFEGVAFKVKPGDNNGYSRIYVEVKGCTPEQWLEEEKDVTSRPRFRLFMAYKMVHSWASSIVEKHPKSNHKDILSYADSWLLNKYSEAFDEYRKGPRAGMYGHKLIPAKEGDWGVKGAEVKKDEVKKVEVEKVEVEKVEKVKDAVKESTPAVSTPPATATTQDTSASVTKAATTQNSSASEPTKPTAEDNPPKKELSIEEKKRARKLKQLQIRFEDLELLESDDEDLLKAAKTISKEDQFEPPEYMGSNVLEKWMKDDTAEMSSRDWADAEEEEEEDKEELEAKQRKAKLQNAVSDHENKGLQMGKKAKKKKNKKEKNDKKEEEKKEEKEEKEEKQATSDE